jgi:hypothetical protein
MQNPEAAKQRRAAIEERAYEIYLQRGATDGHDLDDWLAAEKEISWGHADAGRRVTETPRAGVAIAARVI